MLYQGNTVYKQVDLSTGSRTKQIISWESQSSFSEWVYKSYRIILNIEQFQTEAVQAQFPWENTSKKKLNFILEQIYTLMTDKSIDCIENSDSLLETLMDQNHLLLFSYPMHHLQHPLSSHVGRSAFQLFHKTVNLCNEPENTRQKHPYIDMHLSTELYLASEYSDIRRPLNSHGPIWETQWHSKRSFPERGHALSINGGL